MTSPLEVTLTADRTELSLAEVLTLRVDVSLDTGYALAIDPLADLAVGSEVGGFVIETVGRTAPVREGDRLEHAVTLRLAPTATGELEIPALRFRALPLDGGSPSWASTGALSIDVPSALETTPADFQPATLRPPVEPPPPTGAPPPLAPVAIGAAILIAIGVAVLLRRRPSRGSPFAPLRGRVRSLEGIEDRRDRAAEASAIAREALAIPLGPRVRAATGAELVAVLGPLAPDARARILDFFHHTDSLAYAPASVEAPTDPAPPDRAPPDPAAIVDLAQRLARAPEVAA